MHPAFDSSFYPNRVTIAAGDKIELTTLGFGDTIFVPKGQKAPAFAVPDLDAPVSGAKDAAGADMWFNGRPAFAPNPAAIMPQGGKVIDGSKVVGNGLALDGPPEPWVVSFPKSGKYVLRSALRPGVTLTVNVKKKTRSAKKTVKVGDTVTFTMSQHSIETHNVAFGPKAYLDEHAKRFFGPVFEPFVTFRSEAPGTPISFDGANHGNGYVNTGVLDANPVTAFPKSDRITFTKAGTYAYYCAVHGNDMAGEIVVK
jgi:plastocyanin